MGFASIHIFMLADGSSRFPINQYIVVYEPAPCRSADGVRYFSLLVQISYRRPEHSTSVCYIHSPDSFSFCFQQQW